MPSNRTKTFAVGECAFIRKLLPGKVPIPVILTKTLGPKRFEVELYTNNIPNGMKQQYSSQQIRRPRPDETHPGLTATGSNDHDMNLSLEVEVNDMDVEVTMSPPPEAC